MRPNVILIVLDTARADALEPYGAPAGSTPAIADLARRGAALSRVQATASWTLPSHVSMFTGLLPRAAGILGPAERSQSAAKQVMDAHSERLLPAVLRAAGYTTTAVSTNLWISELSGFDAGFDSFSFVDSGRHAHLHREDLRARLRWDLEGLRASVDDGAGKARRILRERLNGAGSDPFFWFVNLVECHSPYLPPRPWNDLGPLERVRAAEDARRHLTMGAIWRACAGGFDVPGEALERMRHLYASAVRLMDGWLADLLGDLDDAGRLDETLVLVTSDHGENLGEAGLMGHCFSLDQRLTHVPVVAAGPDAPGAGSIVSLAQLPGLITQAAGITDPPWPADQAPEGVAVAQFAPPAPATDPRWIAACHEWGLDPEPAIERIGHPLATATDGAIKLQLRGDREQLYDLRADPLELKPRDPTDADRVAHPALWRALQDHERRQPVVSVENGGAPQTEITTEERRQLEDRMRLLGYM